MASSTIITKDGTEIFYKDWCAKDWCAKDGGAKDGGAGQPIVFSHGWPLSADDWDAQMLFFLSHGFRVIAHDRRGHGRSTQTASGHDMDHYADDLAALTEHLDLKDAVHVGHSTGGGEVVRYIARHGESRVAKAALLSAVPPLMVQTDANPGGLPKSVFDGLQAAVAANRAQFYYDLPAGPFYGFNRPDAKAQEPIIWNWWRQGMMGGAKAHYDGIVAFSQTDFTEDLKKITVPVLVMHGDDDQIVPYADSGPLTAGLLRNGTLKTYKGFPHGMPTNHCLARAVSEGRAERAAEVWRVGAAGGVALTGACFTGTAPIVGLFAVGLMRAAFDTALRFARTERRGGTVPIIEHQAVGCALANAKTAIEAVRSLSWRAACAVDAQAPNATELALHAKVFGSETAVRVITDLMGVVGVDSYDRDMPFGDLVEGAVVLPLFDGGNMGVRRRHLHEILLDPDYDPLAAAGSR